MVGTSKAKDMNANQAKIKMVSEYTQPAPAILESWTSAPRGFQFGATVTAPGRNQIWMVRNSDKMSVLCPLTPAEDEVSRRSTTARLLHQACNAAR